MLFTNRNRHRVAAMGATLALLATACGGTDDTASISEATATATETPGELVAAATAVDLFMDGALASDIVTVDCTLSDGTETSCYEITVVGSPVDEAIGPFCPTTTTTSADDAGIWLDGENLYDADGQFIVDLPEIYDDENWHLHDDDGHVHVTDTPEAFAAAARPDVAEEYQNYCVEGRIEWLDDGEPITSTVQIPTTPVLTGTPSAAGGNLGVTFNGVIIAESAPVDAILGAYTIAAFDDCGGHINPIDGYHLHAATGCSEVGDTAEGETAPFALAMDGFTVHSPLDDGQVADVDLDDCNGHTTDELGYHYHANQPQENGVLTCYLGATVGGATGGPGGGLPGGPPPGGAPTG